jgi:undecaprenyl-diphosphatase
MLAALKSLDQTYFLLLNGLHSPFFDQVMCHGTDPATWLPLYLVVLWLAIRKFRWQTVWIVLFAALMIIISDQLANLVKELTCRPRPSHESGLTGVHTVGGYVGGRWGFYSAHASSNLALAVFLIMVLGSPFRGFAVLMLAYAFFMSYTRIYLGVHYPGDILAGWIAGGLIGWGFGLLSRWFLRKDLSG